MPFFIVTMRHPDLAGWRAHRDAHGEYLDSLVKQGVLRASGPITDDSVRAGGLIMMAPDRDALDSILGRDPFMIAGIVEDLQVHAWDPIFGEFAHESSGRAPQ